MKIWAIFSYKNAYQFSTPSVNISAPLSFNYFPFSLFFPFVPFSSSFLNSISSSDRLYLYQPLRAFPQRGEKRRRKRRAQTKGTMASGQDSSGTTLMDLITSDPTAAAAASGASGGVSSSSSSAASGAVPSTLGKPVSTDRKSKKSTFTQIQNETISAARAINRNLPQRRRKKKKVPPLLFPLITFLLRTASLILMLCCNFNWDATELLNSEHFKALHLYQFKSSI